MTLKISVLIPAYNAAATIRRTLDSVVNQAYPAHEILVVNDGSTDGTAGILDSYPFAIRHIRLSQNRGLVQALNTGLHSATGDWIARLDADDWWEPNHLQEGAAFLANSAGKSPGLIGLRARIVAETGAFLGETPGPLSHEDVLRTFLKDNPFVHSGVLFNREVALKQGGYPPHTSESRFEDYDLWIRIAAAHQVTILPALTVHHVKSPGSLSAIKQLDSLRFRFHQQQRAWKTLPIRHGFGEAAFLTACWLRLKWLEVIPK